MIIEYSVPQVIKILLKRWYVLILCGVLFATVVIPLSSAQYAKALEQYNNHTNFEYVYNDLSEKNLTVQESSVNNSSQSTLPVKYYFEINSYEDLSQGDLLQSAGAISADILVSVYNITPAINEVLVYNGFVNGYTFYSYAGTSRFSVAFASIPENAINLFPEVYALFLQESINTNLGINAVISPVSIVRKAEAITAAAPTPDNDRIFELTEQKIKFNKIILREPTPKSIGFQVLGVAFIAGLLLSAFVVLMVDYLICCCKIEKAAIT